MKKAILKIYRGVPGNQYWEVFFIDVRSGMNVISALLEIQKNPVTADGKKTTPVVWESGCLEEVCGACSMLINSKPRQACSALLEKIFEETGHATITLEPFTKFPLVRDLAVDRASLFDTFKKVKAWVEVDGYFGSGPILEKESQEIMYPLSQCMVCGCCIEGCPQTTLTSAFIGAAAIAQVQLLSIHPTARLLHQERLRVLQQKDGVAMCRNIQNCERVCPKKIPLVNSIAIARRETMKLPLLGTQEGASPS